MKYIESGHTGLMWRIDDLNHIVGARKGGSEYSLIEIMEHPKIHHLYHEAIRRRNDSITENDVR